MERLSLIRKLRYLSQNSSFKVLFKFVVGFPTRKIRRCMGNKAIKEVEDLEGRFTLIYERNAWGSRESISGSGSTLKRTVNVRDELPRIFHLFSIDSFFDAPCGDFNWMKEVDLERLTYIGGDIVKPLIESLNNRYSSENVSFIHIDLTKETFPETDLVLTRDCLFHLSNLDILALLNNFLQSSSRYFLTTTHDNLEGFKNLDVHSGGFRLLDLFSSPFDFPKEVLYKISEPGEDTLPARSLCLWDRNQIEEVYRKLRSTLLEINAD